MNQPKAVLRIGGSQEGCAPALEHLLSFWSRDFTKGLPEEIHEHLFSCCRCLRVCIALEAAAELSFLDGSVLNSPR
jgi:hypothetical protein